MRKENLNNPSKPNFDNQFNVVQKTVQVDAVFTLVQPAPNHIGYMGIARRGMQLHVVAQGIVDTDIWYKVEWERGFGYIREKAVTTVFNAQID